jgi:hypothetical protein
MTKHSFLLISLGFVYFFSRNELIKLQTVVTDLPHHSNNAKPSRQKFISEPRPGGLAIGRAVAALLPRFTCLPGGSLVPD